MNCKCPSCGRTYGVGEVSLSEGLKSDCPHCQVELEYSESDLDTLEQSQDAHPAGSEDWAAATARWAAGGFKASEMPDFIQGQAEQEQMAGSDEQESQDSQDTQVIYGLESLMQSEQEDSEDKNKPVSTPETASDSVEVDDKKLYEKKPDKIEIDLKPHEQPPTSDFKRMVHRQGKAGRLRSWRGLMMVVIIVLVLVLAGLYWYLGDSENLHEIYFSTQGLRVAVVEAPPPSEYPASQKAILHYGRGNQLAHQRKWENAVLEFKKAVGLDPDYPHPHRALGAVYAAMGYEKLSANEYRTYLKLAPKSRDADQVRRVIREQLGK